MIALLKFLAFVGFVCSSYVSAKCGTNEAYNECGSSCFEPICNDPGGRMCPMICTAGCFCAKGFVRNEGVCIAETNCPKPITCGINEAYKKCGSMCGSPTCVDPTFAFTSCAMGCLDGCFCIDGYVKNDKGICIPIAECQMSCPAHEHYSRCGAGCETTCAHPDPTRLICNKMCLEGCVCDDGYVRNGKVCTRAARCNTIGCQSHEKYSVCGNPCENTCANPTLAQVCKAMCRPGCFCKSGYLRKAVGQCVKKNKC